LYINKPKKSIRLTEGQLRTAHNNQCEALYIINSIGITYHQNEVLYIIIAKASLYTPKGVMRYKGDIVALDDIQPNG